MTPKYYYKDPLAAAWQADKFGMKFDAIESESAWDICASTMCQQLTEDDEPFYIHPDSLHILEPMVGDFIEGVGLPIRVGSGLHQMPIEDAIILASSNRIKIIQRNGMAFHWPEKEE